MCVCVCVCTFFISEFNVFVHIQPIKIMDISFNAKQLLVFLVRSCRMHETLFKDKSWVSSRLTNIILSINFVFIFAGNKHIINVSRVPFFGFFALFFTPVFNKRTFQIIFLSEKRKPILNRRKEKQ